MIRPMGKEERRTSLQKKIMASLYELSCLGVMPSGDGLIHLLQGSPVARDYASLITFSSLSSLSSRRGKAALRKLTELGIISSSYSVKGDGYFFSLEPDYAEEAKGYLAFFSTKEKKVKTRKIEFIER